MCKCNGDTVDHLLLHCSIATGFWSMVFGLFGVYRVMPKTVVDIGGVWIHVSASMFARLRFFFLKISTWCIVYGT